MNPNGTTTYRPCPQVSLRDHAIARLNNALSDLDAAIGCMRRDPDIDIDLIFHVREAKHMITGVQDKLTEEA